MDRVPRMLAAAGIVVAGFAVTAWLLFAIPRYQARNVTVEGPDVSAKTAALINEYRRTLVQVIGGVFVLIGALSGAYFTWRQITVTRDGQITDRYTKAIDHLGDDKIAAHVGGIYALDRIGRDSAKDQWMIVKTLSAFIRESTPIANTVDITERPAAEPLRMDVQAALTILGQSATSEPGRIYLARTDLRNGDLTRLLLKYANFREANLQGANLTSANLEGAHLASARLDKAQLELAHLEGAVLMNAQLKGANLMFAHLEGADLSNANLKKANLRFAHLEGANLKEADLEGAFLFGAHVEGADFTAAHLTPDQVSAAQAKTNAKFPWNTGAASLGSPGVMGPRVEG
jgi:hypothetical protein